MTSFWRKCKGEYFNIAQSFQCVLCFISDLLMAVDYSQFYLFSVTCFLLLVLCFLYVPQGLVH